jgi:uncharacterized cupin superfamily protein
MSFCKERSVSVLNKITVSEVSYPDWPLETLGISIVEGHPKGSGKITFQTGDKLVSGGVWGCSTGVFDLTFGWDEMAYLLEGDLTIQQTSGEEIRVKPGDFFFLLKERNAVGSSKSL